MIFYRRLAPVKALSFDLDDTLYDNHPHMLRAEQSLLEWLHREYPQTVHTDRYFWRNQRFVLLKQHPQLHNDMGVLRLRGLQAGLAACGIQGAQNQQGAQDGFAFFYRQRSAFRVSENIRNTLAQLAARFPLVAITNGNVDLAAVGIAEFFPLCFHASLQQPMKPDPCMFNLAADELKLPPQQILHVGDNLEKDVMGALQAGFQAAWYAENRPMDLRHEPVHVLPHMQLATLDELLNLA